MLTLAQRTRIAVQIIVEDDTGRVAACMLAITTLIELLLSLNRIVGDVIVFVSDILEAVEFTGKVFVIGWRSLAFGLGVRL